MLSQNPYSGRVGRTPGTRELPVTGTPYVVVYRVAERVEILAVVHGAHTWPESFGGA
ncbi:type II toxin-antitoxin system RelE/ParE family toxin [Aureimonas sp. SA4125]|uniref:type II toxin-antitoxin system RelE/ParE family toxin n=1 Tax=Aureimonas sp. SA4125 TaxID=2826993 RepID=UPI00226B0C1B|nr:type II toxin-antitoxin system RelE/ParE family toxin [Aureimonas sp. SA4125]